MQHELDRGHVQAEDCDNAEQRIQNRGSEPLASLEVRFLAPDLGLDGSPVATRHDRSIEPAKRRVSRRRSKPRDHQRDGQAHEGDHREGNVFGLAAEERQLEQRCRHARDRPGGVAPAVEPPPVPAQHVGHQHTGPQNHHDPRECRLDPPAERSHHAQTESDDHDRGQIAGPHEFAPASAGSAIGLV